MSHARGRCLPMPAALGLLGGLTLLLAFAMPWFGFSTAQGSATLSGQFLDRLLAGTSDLRRLLPGASGGPEEVLALRALVLLFPTCGVLALASSLVVGLRQRWGRFYVALLGLCGAAPLLAVVVGLGRLPAGASLEIGLAVMALAGVLLLAAAGLALRQRPG